MGVIKYMQYHHTNPAKEIEKPLKSANMREVVSEWDANFVEVDQETLFELILAANYMDIKPLLDLTCAKVASMIKGRRRRRFARDSTFRMTFPPKRRRPSARRTSGPRTRRERESGLWMLSCRSLFHHIRNL